VDLGFSGIERREHHLVHNKKSTECDLARALPVYHGYFAQGSNAASIQNAAGDIADLRPIQRADYGWEVGCSGPEPHKVLSLGAEQFIPIGRLQQPDRDGRQPIGVYLGSGFLRCGVSNVRRTSCRGGGRTDSLRRRVSGPPAGRAVRDRTATRWQIRIRVSYKTRTTTGPAVSAPRSGTASSRSPACSTSGTAARSGTARRARCGATYAQGCGGQRAVCYAAPKPGAPGTPKIFGQAAGMMPGRGPGAGVPASIVRVLVPRRRGMPVPRHRRAVLEDAGFANCARCPSRTRSTRPGCSASRFAHRHPGVGP